jgi:lysophospholipase L1-like esterase
MERANQLVAAACEQDERLTYVDVASGMLNAEGTPRKELLKKDNLHMTREGYILWRDVLRPVLLKNEGEFDLTP